VIYGNIFKKISNSCYGVLSCYNVKQQHSECMNLYLAFGLSVIINEILEVVWTQILNVPELFVFVSQHLKWHWCESLGLCLTNCGQICT
jgi:hypothetical protein